MNRPSPTASAGTRPKLGASSQRRSVNLSCGLRYQHHAAGVLVWLRQCPPSPLLRCCLGPQACFAPRLGLLASRRHQHRQAAGAAKVLESSATSGERKRLA